MTRPWSPEAKALLEQAAASLRARRVHESLRLYDVAIRMGVDPLAVGGERWMAHMLLGDYPAAWAISEAVLKRADPAKLNATDRPFHRRAVWDGTPFDGRSVLIRCYHGLGDILQFARYLPLVARRASRLWVQAPEAAHPLLSRVAAGIGGLLPLTDALSVPNVQVQAELMELPFAFRTRLDGLPPPLRLAATGAVGARIGARCGREPRRVGLAWAAGGWDGGHRSVPLEQVERLMASTPWIDWVCLQRGAALESADALPFRDNGPRTMSLDDTAAIIGGLDLVVTVDTVVAHLAGSVGVPVWTLLHHEADWRWLLERTDCPWYPGMTLIRQSHAGDWDSVVRGVGERLGRDRDQ